MAPRTLIIFAVEDLARAKRFYTEAFGWTQGVDVPVYAEFTLSDGLRFGLYDRVAFGHNTGRVPARTPAGEISPTELYLYVDDPLDAIDRVRRAGARELSPLSARPWGDEAAYFADPDGNVLALARCLPEG